MDDTPNSVTEPQFQDTGLAGGADLSEPPAHAALGVKPNVATGEQGPAGWNSSDPRDAGVPGSVQEYDARRCPICGAKFPPFGFGPPLTQPGTTLWACGAHRVEIERRLTGAHRLATCEDRQPSLL
jgi:hypothetical protein